MRSEKLYVMGKSIFPLTQFYFVRPSLLTLFLPTSPPPSPSLRFRPFKTMTCTDIKMKIRHWHKCAYVSNDTPYSSERCASNEMRALNNQCNANNMVKWTTAIGCCETCRELWEEHNYKSGTSSPTEGEGERWKHSERRHKTGKS